MTDLKYLYVHAIAWLFALYSFISAWSRRCHCYNYDFWVLPSVLWVMVVTHSARCMKSV